MLTGTSVRRCDDKNKFSFPLDYQMKWDYIIEDECVRSQCVILSTSENVQERVETVALWFLPCSSEMEKERIYRKLENIYFFKLL